MTTPTKKKMTKNGTSIQKKLTKKEKKENDNFYFAKK